MKILKNNKKNHKQKILTLKKNIVKPKFMYKNKQNPNI